MKRDHVLAVLAIALGIWIARQGAAVSPCAEGGPTRDEIVSMRHLSESIGR